MGFSRFLYKINDVGNQINKFNISINNFMDENKSLLQEIFAGKDVSVSKFLELYDKRIYDVHSRQDDIKYMKELDFKGVYIIKNLSNNRYYLGCGDRIFRKVDRHFKGFGNQKVYADYKCKNRFVVSFFQLEKSGFGDLKTFENSVRKQLEKNTEFQDYDIASIERSDKNCNLKDVQKTGVIKSKNKKRVAKKYGKTIRILWGIIIIFFFCLLIYLECENYIPVSVSEEDLLGENYEKVVQELQDAGFLLVNSSPEYSLSIEQIEYDYIVYDVQIGDDNSFESDDIYRNNVNIVVRYRTLEKKSIPLSSEEMKNQNYEEVLSILQDAGFVNVSFYIEYDLIFGLLKKDGTIEKVTINGNDEFEKGYQYRPDSEIIITYHTYSKKKS